MRYCLVFILLFHSMGRIAATETHKHNEKEIFSLARANIEQFRKAEFTLKFGGISESEINEIEIEAEQINHEFLFGCIIFDLVNHGKVPEDEDLFKERFKQLFNFAVFPFYWAAYEPKQGQTNETKIKEVADWCIENGITTKGHPLAWTHTAGTPKWLNEFSAEESKKLLQQRIENIVSSFKSKIDIWDVLNEVIHTVNWDVALQENLAGRDNRYVGRNFMSDDIGFIDSCFQWAQAANPDADLILNEFDIVYNEHSRQRFYDVLKALQKRNSPVKGIGIQAHEPYKGRIYYSPQQIWETFETYSDFNLPLHITELIPVSNGDSIMGGYRTGIWTEQVQAEFAEMIFTLSFGHPLIHSVNWWGFSDRNIWQPNGGLVDENLNPKPVYETLDRLINQEWKTKQSGLKLNSEKEVNFRGFRGDYQIRIKHKGKLIKSVDVNYDKITDEKEPVIINL
jgi:endo-1,4-beta-xylanase